ncbi:MAG: ferritin family protein [Candidatus Aminicenantes bacterium]|nr:ferritin family protein [Candidatus Aminicenantes bacterium]
MAIDKKLAAWQVLGVAIRSEVDAAAFYARLQERVKNVILVQKLKFLAMEEEHHKKILERLLGQKYPDKPKDVPESSLMPPIAVSLGAEPAVLALFEAALKAEETAEGFYNDAAERTEDEAGRKILAYLGRVERSHQAMIKSELELIQKFPDYYNIEDFHLGEELFHVGP